MVNSSRGAARLRWPAILALLAILAMRPALAQSDVFLIVSDWSGLENPKHLHSASGMASGALIGSSDTRFGGRRSWLVSGLASLQEGRLGVYTQEDMAGPKEVHGGVNSIAAISDTLTFNGPRAGVVVMQMTLHGAFTSLTGASFMSARAELWFNQSLDHMASVTASFDGSFGAPVRYQHGSGVTQLGSPDDPANVRALLRQEILLSPGSSLQFEAVLSSYTRAAESSYAAGVFDNTALLSIELPEDWTFQSASGVFLAGPPLPVPEPGTWAMWLAGLLLMLAQGRAYRRARGRLAATALLIGLAASTGASASASVSTTIDFVGTVSDGVSSGRVELTRELTGSGINTTPGIAGDWYSLGHAHADDQRGVVGATSLMQLRSGARRGAPPMLSGASIGGTLHFMGTRGGLVSLTMDVFGAFSNPGPFSSDLEAAAFINFGTSHADIGFRWFGPSVESNVAIQTTGEVHVAGREPGGLAGQLRVTQFMNPGDFAAVSMGLNTKIWRAITGAAVVADFGHTARISLQMPEGLVLAPSASGFLMAAPVPEPAVAWMLLPGLALLVARVARRDRRFRPVLPA